MANGNGDLTKSDLQDTVDQVTDLLCDVYTPESSREDLAEAVGNALDVLQGSDTGDDDDGDSDDDYYDTDSDSYAS